MYSMPENIIEKGFLSEVFTSRDSLGIIIDKSASNQLAYDAIRSVQNYLPSQKEICFFVQEISALPLTPTTGLYYSSSLMSYKGNLLATSISSTHDAIRSGSGGRVVFYIRDLGDLAKHDKQAVNYILSSPNVIKICASENYKKFIIQNYPAAIIHKRVVEDFNISDICEIVFGENDGLQK